MTIDGDVVVIVEDDQLTETPVTRERRAFARHALHVAPVAHDAVRVVVDNLAVRLVEATGEVLFDHGQTDGVANTHTERTRGDFDALGDEVLRVTRGLGLPLTELLDVFNLRVTSACASSSVIRSFVRVASRVFPPSPSPSLFFSQSRPPLAVALAPPRGLSPPGLIYLSEACTNRAIEERTRRTRTDTLG